MPKSKSSKTKQNAKNVIKLRDVRQHNLKGFDLDIQIGKLTVISGPSGSGKSSLAFHTLYAEGQRRYVETFSPYVRQFMDRMDKPAVGKINGIPPSIAIEQKNNVRTTRSTVGTITELNDYLKLLYPRLSKAYDPKTGAEIKPDHPSSVAQSLIDEFPENASLHILFPISVPRETVVSDFLTFLNSQGYIRLWVNGTIFRTDEPDALANHTFDKVAYIVQDRLKLQKSAQRISRLREALETASRLGKGQWSVQITSPSSEPIIKNYSQRWINPETGFELKAPTPSMFSFNSPIGACPTCRGFGKVIGIDYYKTIPNPTLSLQEGAVKAFQTESYLECQRDLIRLAPKNGVRIDIPFEDLSPEEKDWIIYGEFGAQGDSDAAWKNGDWYGVKGLFDWLESKSYKMHVRIFLAKYRSYTDCPDCQGTRLKPEASCFKINDVTLPEVWKMEVKALLPWILKQQASFKAEIESDPTTKLIFREILSRLYYLNQVGLGYLCCDRETRSLSGGEIERVNLTACLGSSLTNTLFVLDEPTVGLHPRDIKQLVEIMHQLRDQGNTVVVVEHEESVIREADQLIDIGPASGEFGGEITYQGDLKEPSLKNNTSLTLDYLTGRAQIEIPTNRRHSATQLQIKGARHHNLKGVNIDLPLGIFTCLAGVSGSGKSTLAHNILYSHLGRIFKKDNLGNAGFVESITGGEFLDDIMLVDQSSLSRTPRSTPAVYVGAFTAIRELFAQTAQAKASKLTPGYFSFNSGDGRCDRCWGNGFEKIEMQFLSDLYLKCPACDGKRYRTAALEYEYYGKNISQTLQLTVGEAISFFQKILEQHSHEFNSKREKNLLNKVIHLLKPLREVGLDYLRLGQPLNTLSGGESQRLKLVELLSEVNDIGRMGSQFGKLLILDEPTTGLHFNDVKRLIKVFQKIVDAGHSLLVIEHNIDVLKCADWIIEMGPEAGDAGGEIVATGTPEELAKTNTLTSSFLKNVLHLNSKCSTGNTSETLNNNSAEYLNQIHQLDEAPPKKKHSIQVRGAREHNLKNINIDIPTDEMVVVTGLSGSGKSTLSFDIIFGEGQRRFLDSISPYARQFAEQLEKPDIDKISSLPPTVAIEQRVSRGGGKSTVGTTTEVWHFLRLLYAKLGIQHCPTSGEPLVSQSSTEVAQQTTVEIKKGRTLIIAPIIKGRKGYHTDVAEWAARNQYDEMLVDGQFVKVENFQRLARFKEHDIDVVVETFEAKDLKSPDAQNRIQQAINEALKIGKGILRLYTSKKELIVKSTALVSTATGQSFEPLDPFDFSFNSARGWCPECRGHGLIPKKMKKLDKLDSILEEEVEYDKSMEKADANELIPCDSCQGERLKESSRHVKIFGYTLPSLAQQPVRQIKKTLQQFQFKGREKEISRDILPEITQRLDFLEQVGLGYLQLDRSANTLSGGEAQRIRLAAQLGSNLRGVLYVLDEPTIGLHPRDNVKLLDALQSLQKTGNSLLIVEHDEETMQRADTIIDLGPGAGRLGGEIIAQGSLPQVKRQKKSITGRTLANPIQHPIRGKRRSLPKIASKTHWMRLEGCQTNNLKNISAKFPVGRLTVITGVSGGGKSSLMRGSLLPAAEKALGKKGTYTKGIWKKQQGFESIKSVFEMDQSPIGKTSRSCPATYVKIFDEIRKVFAQLPEARARGYNAGRFSFNNEEGRCPECKGNGRIKLEMDFLASTWVPCETCNQARYNQQTLEVLYSGKSIADVLAMTIDEAADFFASHPKLAKTLNLLRDTGLGYLQLGQPSPTLSGGEAQRLKLVTELTKGRSPKAALTTEKLLKRNLYLIEEPTIGLHPEDVRKLIEVLHRLVDEGHTVVIVEHNEAIMAEADYLIDIGPEAGDLGGNLVAEGTPEKVAKNKDSVTAPFLKKVLQIK